MTKNNFRPTMGILLIECLYLSGCSILNPYNSEFQCKETYKGTCQDTESSYWDSISDLDQTASDRHRASLDDKKNRKKGSKCTDCDNNSSVDAGSSGDEADSSLRKYDNLYRKSLYRELSQLIDDPKTPIVKPPEVMRILMLGYTDQDNQLLSHRYIYFFTTEPKWVISPSDEVR